MNKMMKIILCILLLCNTGQLIDTTSSFASYVKTRIIIADGGPTVTVRRQVGTKLTHVMQEINKVASGVGNLTRINHYCTDPGFVAIKALVESDKIYSIMPEQKLNLIDILPSGYFEVRGIKVNLGSSNTIIQPRFEYLVFTLTPNGKIDGLDYAIKNHESDYIVSFGEKITDPDHEKIIRRFIEKYRTAYNKKDSLFLKQVFSDYALIIVGQVVTESGQNGDFMEKHSFFNEKAVRFFKRTKRQYLDSLRVKVFNRNSWIDVKFHNIEIIKHPTIDEIYGVTLYQEWTTPTYSDTGYVFLLFDLPRNEKQIIHVRCWQPKPYINLYHFEIDDD